MRDLCQFVINLNALSHTFFFCFEIIVCYFKDKYYINGCGSWPSEKGLREIVETQTHIWASLSVCTLISFVYLLCICLLPYFTSRSLELKP